MNYIDYVSRIRFRLIKPQTPIIPLRFEKHLRGLSLGPWFKTIFWFESFNTRLALSNLKMKHRLQSISNVPRMSTFAIGALVNRGVRQMPAGRVFVNVGVWHGFTLLAGMIGNARRVCIGVDNFSQYGGPKRPFIKRFERYGSDNHRFYEMDYVDYFSDVHQDPIGFYIYDGAHHYEEQVRGLRIAEPYFADDCIILIDDANYSEVQQALIDFISDSPNNYRVFSKPTFCNSHPTFWNGITVLQKIG